MSHSDKKDVRFHNFIDAEAVKKDSAEKTVESSIARFVEPSREELGRKSLLPPRLSSIRTLQSPPNPLQR